MGQQFSCPHCGGVIEVVGGDAGVDGTGAKTGKFVPKPAKPVRGKWRSAFIIGKRGEIFKVKLADGTFKEYVGPVQFDEYHENDGSISDLVRIQFPHHKCGEEKA